PAAPMNGDTLANADVNARVAPNRWPPGVPVTANHAPPLGDVMKTSGAAHGDGSVSRWWMNALPVDDAVKLALVTLAVAAAPLAAAGAGPRAMPRSSVPITATSDRKSLFMRLPSPFGELLCAAATHRADGRRCPHIRGRPLPRTTARGDGRAGCG